MLHIQVKSKRDPHVLAELIAASEPDAQVDPKLAVEAKLIREQRDYEERTRPSLHQLDTMNFHKLDDENDWTDL